MRHWHTHSDTLLRQGKKKLIPTRNGYIALRNERKIQSMKKLTKLTESKVKRKQNKTVS